MAEWDTTEAEINKITNILESDLLLSPFKQNDPIKCKDCLFRNIAILIVSGNVKLNKILDEKNIMWFGTTPQINKNSKQHGKSWHNSYLQKITHFFNNHNLKTSQEPDLYFGKADIFIPDFKVFIEIGTIGLYKLYINLLNMSDCRILICPENNISLEFIL